MSSYSGNIFMVVAPSGAGKSSLVNALLANDPTVVLSISCTTRAPRPGEENHKHYRFISHEQFNSLREQNALLEWAEVHGNYYGTPRDRSDEALQQGNDRSEERRVGTECVRKVQTRWGAEHTKKKTQN